MYTALSMDTTNSACVYVKMVCVSLKTAQFFIALTELMFLSYCQIMCRLFPSCHILHIANWTEHSRNHFGWFVVKLVVVGFGHYLSCHGGLDVFQLGSVYSNVSFQQLTNVTKYNSIHHIHVSGYLLLSHVTPHIGDKYKLSVRWFLNTKLHFFFLPPSFHQNKRQ